SCGDALAAAGLALHPGLHMAAIPAGAPAGRSRVLFLCTGNSARSPVAAALLNKRAPQLQVASAGSPPKALHPKAVRVLRNYEIELSGRPPQHLSALADEAFDHVITLCDRVREVCPDFPGRAEQVHWSIPDPAASGGTDEETYPAFERMAAELDARIG